MRKRTRSLVDSHLCLIVYLKTSEYWACYQHRDDFHYIKDNVTRDNYMTHTNALRRLG